MASYWYEEYRDEFSVGDFLLSDQGDELLGVVVEDESGDLERDPQVYRPDVGQVTSMADLVGERDLNVVAVTPPAEDRRDEVLAAIEGLQFGDISLEDTLPQSTSLPLVRTTCQFHPDVKVPPRCPRQHPRY